MLPLNDVTTLKRSGVLTMKTTTLLLKFISILPLIPLCVLANDSGQITDRPTIALVNRVVEIVERRSPDVEWRTAKIGDLLNSGDIIKTGPASFSLVRFYDNSHLRIRELSQVTIYADRDRENYHRNIHVTEGSVGFDVRKREADRFEFTTPTSVASIRGSTGSFISRMNEPDILLMVTGLAVLRNLLSGEEIEVRGGEIAFSYTDGSLEKRPLTQRDLDEYEDRVERERRQRTIEIRTIDEQGNPRTIRIIFEEDVTKQ